MKTKSERPDDYELLMRAVRSATPPPGRNDYPRWACVRDLFEVRSKVAMQLCREAKLNLHECLDGPVEDLPPDFQDLADVIGSETTLKRIENRSGEGMYIPKVEKIYRAARDRTIRKEFRSFLSYNVSPSGSV